MPGAAQVLSLHSPALETYLNVKGNEKLGTAVSQVIYMQAFVSLCQYLPFLIWRRKWQPTLACVPKISHGRKSQTQVSNSATTTLSRNLWKEIILVV